MTDSSTRQPLAETTVVVCRPRHQSGSLLQELRQLGAVVVELPLLEVSPPVDRAAALAAAVRGLAGFDWIVVTSANGVGAVEAHRRGPWPRAVRVAVVGPATAAAANRAGWPVDFEPSEATGERLAAELPVDPLEPCRVLAPLAELAAPALVDHLRSRGADVTRVQAYRMTEPWHAPALLAAASVADVVLLTSPSTAHRFAALVGTHVPAVVIGPSTEAAAIDDGFAVLATAEPHTVDGLVAALVNSIEP